ncbi:DUF4965 domain-containing protein [Parabacteroides sp. PF5-6]|uniref:glutaminase domain-containing protein n=1 Tax=Parabacteroides sp. PF5-6 TaxID=1742403 RepID=UPI003216E039|nr:sugar lactone lactonase YvrE/predicted small lipoprotein YifL [Parabacteroides sp. PF5-6]
MKTHVLLIISCLSVWGILTGCGPKGDLFSPAAENNLRAPAYPLVTIDPYTCAWSFTDQLNEDPVRHWTGKPHQLVGALRVDGKVYRFMGVEDIPLTTFLPTAAAEKWDAAYTEKSPVGNWIGLDFNESAWEKGKAAFGTPEMKNLSTIWKSKDIWVRRTFELMEDYSKEKVYLEYSHDDIFELYVNGVQVVATDYCWNDNVLLELSDEAKATLKPGKNIIAAHCHNRTGGGLVDFGLFKKENIGDVFTTKAVQKSATVMPTQTYYTFECGPVELDLVFTSPLLMDDLELMSTPINYISYQVRMTDGKAHDIQMYMDATPQWAQHTADQEMEDTSYLGGGPSKIAYSRTGTVEQPVLKKKGDDIRIDWGYFYIAAEKTNQVDVSSGNYFRKKKQFLEDGTVSMLGVPVQKENLGGNVLAFSENLGKVSSSAAGFMMIGYDDLYAIQYFGDDRMAYWKQDGKVDMVQALEKANANYANVMERCRKFDAQLMRDAEKAGNKQYAELCALAYRQSVAAHKLVTDKNGNLLFLSKENFSNGSIGTVDITYPSSPLYLIYNPELLKGMMNPIFYYSESGKWNKPFAAHDVGTYPQANGQTYGGDMPVEESGNMLILTTILAMREGNANYAKKHWEVLTTWANYLVKEGLDPENQLCTDDFAGHFAHNTNLSIKAIMGIAGYGKLAEMLGDQGTANKYMNEAKEMARKWVLMANAWDHYRLTFDQPNTWSQKYNLIWDKFFGLGIFPPEVAQKEMAYYLTHQNKYGLPLDSRKTYTKSDWIMWSACLTDDLTEFDQLVSLIYKYANETTTRMPLSDWHETTNGNSVGFRARSVVGGYFMKMLEDKMKPKKAMSAPRLADVEQPLQTSKLFVELPDYCPTPDGMAIAPNGDLVVACPNFADISQPACLIRINKEGKVTKWTEVPVLPETGWASPMGIAFHENGDLYICDNQGWSGAEKAQNKGRVLRLRFENDRLTETIVVASGMEHPNGIRIREGKLYVTQSSLSKIKDPSGLLVSGVYCFDANDRNIKVNNTLEDKNLLTTVITKNKDVQYGLDGIVFDPQGNLYVGNFGDGALHKMVMDASGKVISSEVWAQDPTQLRTTDGICIDDDGNIWIADFSENAVAKVDKQGKIQRIAQSPDCDGSNGGLDQPGEPIVWNGKLIVTCFDIVTGPDKTNTGHDKPFTIAQIEL